MQEERCGIVTVASHPVWRPLIPLFITSGFQQGFFFADYTKVTNSVNVSTSVFAETICG